MEHMLLNMFDNINNIWFYAFKSNYKIYEGIKSLKQLRMHIVSNNNFIIIACKKII